MKVLAGIALLAGLSLAGAAAYADIHKCSQGGRLLYQAAPCPNDSLPLPAPAIPPRPSAYAEEEARLRASREIAAAAAIRQRERKEVEASDRQATAERKKQARDCARLHDRIERAEAAASAKKGGKTTAERAWRAYREACAAP